MSTESDSKGIRFFKRLLSIVTGRAFIDRWKLTKQEREKLLVHSVEAAVRGPLEERIAELSRDLFKSDYSAAQLVHKLGETEARYGAREAQLRRDFQDALENERKRFEEEREDKRRLQENVLKYVGIIREQRIQLQNSPIKKKDAGSVRSKLEENSRKEADQRVLLVQEKVKKAKEALEAEAHATNPTRSA